MSHTPEEVRGLLMHISRWQRRPALPEAGGGAKGSRVSQEASVTSREGARETAVEDKLREVTGADGVDFRMLSMAAVWTVHRKGKE